MKNQARQRRHTQSGSIFFWIFFMVFLFAALSFALTQGFRSGSSSITRESDTLTASEIADFGNSMRTAVRALRVNGCSDTDISFENDVVTGYTNPTSPVNESCHVFKPAGGGVSWPKFGDDFEDEDLTFGPTIIESRDGSKQMGTNEAELIMSREVSKGVCDSINQKLDNPPSWESYGRHFAVREDNGQAWEYHDLFQGVYTVGSTPEGPYKINMGLEHDAALMPPASGCTCDAPGLCDVAIHFYYYTTLLVR